MKHFYFLTFLLLLCAGSLNAQIIQATDINTSDDSDIDDPVLYNGAIYFEADAGDGTSLELYRLNADGTAEMVKDINTDPDDSSPSSFPANFIEYKGLLYFKANDGDETMHDNELWVTDGTTENTKIVADIWPGVKNGSNPQQMFVFNDNLYFQAKYESSTQLWKYNGTDAPVKVTDLKDNGYATPMYPVVDETNNWVYFQANNGKNELHILKADETVEIIDINADASKPGYNGKDATIFNGKLYFEGDNGSNGDELWISDGTTAGTIMVKDINTTGDDLTKSDSNPSSFTAYNDQLYFIADAGTGDQLWVTDGTEANTQLVVEPFAGDDGDMGNLFVYNEKLYFSATDGTNGVELWVYDGETASMFKDINEEGDSDPQGFAIVEGLLFFEAIEEADAKPTLWVTDGALKNTVSVAVMFNSTETPTDVDAGEFVVNGSKLYFTADNASGFDDFYMVDAKTIFNNVKQVTDINTSGDSGIGYPILYNGAIYFEADAGDAASDELYRINADGTTELVKNINVDPDDTTPASDPAEFIEYNGLLYFRANAGDKTETGKELWVTDGTTENTRMVADIWTGAGNDANPQYMFVFNGNLYLQAKYESSTQWWKYNGTDAPTKVTTLNEDGYATPMYPVVDATNNWVYFQANNGTNELHILKADETVEIIDINSVASKHGYNGKDATIFNGKLYFEGDNGTDGDELWMSDGTAAGTVMVKDINTSGDDPTKSDSNPSSFTAYNNLLYFIADAGTGDQLWVTDGTEANTQLVAEPFTGDDGDMGNLFVYNEKLYFTATDGTTGVELWAFDGTSASLFKDINPAGDSDPKGFTIVDGLLFFEAESDDSPELWVTDGTQERTMSVAAAMNTFNALDVRSEKFVVDGTVLYYVADDANGHDDFFAVDANKFWSYNVTFNVSNGTDAMEGVAVEFDGQTQTTNAEGTVTFEYVRIGDELAYTTTFEAYDELNGTVTVSDKDVSVDVTMELTAYDITFHVSHKGDNIEGATISFNGTTATTDANGNAVFTDVLPATGLDYTVTLTDYDETSGTADADTDKTVEVDLIPTGIENLAGLKLKVYPNPASDIIYIDGITKDAAYNIYDMSQRLIKSGVLNNNNISLDLSSGMYLLNILTDNGNYSEKLIVK